MALAREMSTPPKRQQEYGTLYLYLEQMRIFVVASANI